MQPYCLSHMHAFILVKTVSSLTNETATTLAFNWNTTGFAKGNYTIIAFAVPATNEADTADNILEDGWVIVAIAGDLSGPEGVPDGLIDIDDVTVPALHFGEYDP